MICLLYEYPTAEDWKRILNLSPLKNYCDKADNFRSTNNIINSAADLNNSIAIPQLIYDLQNRLFHVMKSYVMLMFYKEKGIPDKEWVNSSIEFFPCFEEKHHSIKIEFDYYVDVFYYKYFSAWDNILHLLNFIYKLGITDFKRKLKIDHVSELLKNKNENIYKELKRINTCEAYKKAIQIRNNIVHNELISSVGLSAKTSETGNKITKVGVGIKQYIPSEEIVQNIQAILGLFNDFLNVIQET